MRVLFETEFWKPFVESTVTTPAPEIMMLLVVTAVCMIARWSRLGLMVAFGYTYRWGWLLMHQEFGSYHGMLMIYYISGILAAAGAVIAFLIHRE